MSRFPDAIMPDVEALNALFSSATGEPEQLDERDRLLLLVWERKVRERVLLLASSPTGEPHRWKLPDERHSLTHRFKMTDNEGIVIRCSKCSHVEHKPVEYKAYMTMGMYADGRLGELFCEIAKEGSFVSGIVDALCFVISLSLQHGVPLEAITRRLRHTKFEPSGMVEGAPKELRGFFGSLLDYIARFLELRFLRHEQAQGTEHE